LLATANIRLDFWLVHFGRTPRIITRFTHAHCVLLVNLSSASSVTLCTSLEVTCRFLPHWCTGHPRPSTCSVISTHYQHSYCNLVQPFCSIHSF
jgi:hypothetical protein